MRALLTAVVAAGLILPAGLAAQEEEPKPEKYEDASWYALVQVDFKPGKRDKAMKMVKDYFAPASEASGTEMPVMHLQHQSGEWDWTIIWHMKGGPGDMEWKQTAEDIKWQKELAELAGGPEKAGEMMEEWSSYIARENVTIAMQQGEM